MNTYFLYIVILIITLVTFFYLIKIKQKKVKQLQNLQHSKQYLEKQLNYLQKKINENQELVQAKQSELFIVSQKLTQKKEQLNNYISNYSESLNKKLESLREIEQQAADQYFINLETEYTKQENIFKQKIEQLNSNYQIVVKELDNLKATRKAAHEALLKEQQIKNNKDNYRLIPTENNLKDINCLQKIKKELYHPRILSMLIWQTFWQPLAKEKFPIILQAKTKMGIYKITNLITEECYIGQSTDIYKRWNQHCKAGLGIDTPMGNKLYKAIQEYGLQNFTFQLLIQCERKELDEKEKYFIELYEANTYGYNSTGGNN